MTYFSPSSIQDDLIPSLPSMKVSLSSGPHVLPQQGKREMESEKERC